MANDLKLNSLNRYRKSSVGLILEEHSHCEVPAGCGGVVFRWIDPREALPVTISLASPGRCSLTLDGAACPSSRALLRYGEHSFALSIECPEGGALLFSARTEKVARSRPISPIIAIDSAPDGRWRASTEPPDTELWRHPGFDDTLWTPLGAAKIPAAWTARNAPWHIQQLLKNSVLPLELPRAPCVCLRRRFEVSLPEAP